MPSSRALLLVWMKIPNIKAVFCLLRSNDIALMLLKTIYELVPSNGISAASLLNGLTKKLRNKKRPNTKDIF